MPGRGIPAFFKRQHPTLPDDALQQAWWAFQESETNQGANMAGNTSTDATVATPGPVALTPFLSPMNFEQSEDVADLVAALAEAQADFKSIPADNVAEVRKDGRLQYSYRYASLGAVLSATRPALAKRGVALMFGPSVGQSALNVTAVVRKGDQWMAVTMGGPWQSNRGNNMQGIGGSLTYIRRYAVQCLLGVAPDEDVDGANGEVNTPTSDSKKTNDGPRAPVPGDVPANPEPRAEWFTSQLRILNLDDKRSRLGVGNWMKAQGLKLSGMVPEKVVDMLLYFNSAEGKKAVNDAAGEGAR